MWQQWANGILGLWVMTVPFLQLPPDVTLWIMGLTGIVIVAFSAEGAMEHGEEHDRPKVHHSTHALRPGV